MLIPSRTQCMELLGQFDMPQHIRRHSLLVAEVALLLAARLNQNSSGLDLRLIEAAALLHDVGKMSSLKTGENHAVLGAQMIQGIVAPAVARIVEEHITLDSSQVAGPVTESLIVNYSDKRVRHDQVVLLEERYYDLIERYSKGPSHIQFLRHKLDLCFALERTIFSHLTIEPRGPEIMGITIDRIKGA
ncbi:MAG: HDIG domain-containing metalloprotein [Syntrophobacteraceae bacterium]